MRAGSETSLGEACRDFGPFFLKFGSYFPYTGKLCCNGHESLKRQLAHRGIAFEPLDHGVRACGDVRRCQALADGLSAAQLEALLRKWLARLPSPFTVADRRAGYRYACSLLQLECSLTQVLDRPLTGRVFFEEVIRENLDVGRPDHVLLFGRRVTRATPGRFRTRVLTDGVTPSLHLDYKHCRIKQYHKEGQALRTETTINDARDFGLRKGLAHLAALRQVGFAANRRLLDVQRCTHDCLVGEAVFAQVQRPQVVDGQRVSALRFADPRGQALLAALVVFRLLPHGFGAADFRQHLAPLLGLAPAALTPGRVTYDLRRLRLHGFIARIPKSHRYHVTPAGLRLALFFTRVYARVLRPGLAHVAPALPRGRAAPRGLRSARAGGGCLVHPGQTRRVKLDAFATSSVLQATLGGAGARAETRRPRPAPRPGSRAPG